MWDLYLAFEAAMGLGKPFDPMAASQSAAETEVPLAFVESVGLCSKICKRIKVAQIAVPPQPGLAPGPQFAIQEQIVGWLTEETKER